MGQHLNPAGAADAASGTPVNLHDYEALAQARLAASAWAYFAGGAGDEQTLADNAAAWQRLRLLPRVARDLTGGHTRCTLGGRTLAAPLLLAPVAFQRLAHADGEAASALAAAAQGAGFVLSAQASQPLEAVARLVRDEADRGPLWFQLYAQPEPGATLALAQRARDAGFEALVLTVDAPVHGARDRERRAGFQLPPGISAVNLGPTAAPPPGLSRFDLAARHALPFSALAELARHSGLPVWVKGVLHADDARAAVAAGAAGVIVSNHGGRTLDTAVSTAQALPAIAQALATLPGPRPGLLVDGGIRRGTDVLKALALGADAVLLGRPQVMALAAGGAYGVAHMLRLLRDELEIAMILCGCRTLADIHPGLLTD
ncbi:MAG: alpha-hydroxy acid oxidase [Rubrivivax sp.]